ncbi:MAG: DUF4785 domain-containing protein [Gammaproteobacteria bacterium]
MNLYKSIVLSAASLLMVNAVTAETLALRGDVSDLRAERLQKAPTAPLANTNREAVSFSSLVSSAYQAESAQAFVATSREYRTNVSAEELKRGFSIRTTGPGAVVALSPLSEVKGAGLSPLDITISTPEGNVLRGSEGMDQLVDQRAIKATGVPFSNGMVGFRLNRTLGSGEFTVQASKGVAAENYLLHVLDAQGSAELSLTAPQQALVGQAFEATGQFKDAKTSGLKTATAFLLSPAGDRIAARVSMNGNAYSVVSTTSRASSFDQGLWELHVTATDVNGVQRDIKTAFASAYSTARFDGDVERDDLSFQLGVETASSGRYEASAILYGTTKSGLVPVASSATAQWLEQGSGQINLTFDPAQVKASGVVAPFVLQSVTLKDQSRMAVLERIARTASF